MQPRYAHIQTVSSHILLNGRNENIISCHNTYTAVCYMIPTFRDSVILLPTWPYTDETISCAHTHGLYLPYTHDSICNEDEEYDERFDKGCDRPFTFFKPCQGLVDREATDRWGPTHTSFTLCVYNRLYEWRKSKIVTQKPKITSDRSQCASAYQHD